MEKDVGGAEIGRVQSERVFLHEITKHQERSIFVYGRTVPATGLPITGHHQGGKCRYTAKELVIEDNRFIIARKIMRKECNPKSSVSQTHQQQQREGRLFHP